MMEGFFFFSHLHLFFFSFFGFFFYLLPPTHSQPHRKTTGELTFRIKRGLMMLLLLQRNLQMRTGGKSQVTKLSHRHPLRSSSLSSSELTAAPKTLQTLSPFMDTSQSIAICAARSMSLAIVQVWKFRLHFLIYYYLK